MRPKLIAVGVGPGAPDLLTLRAVEKIRSARAIAYTANRRGESYARTTASGWISPEAVEIPLPFSMSPDRAARLQARREAARRIRSALALYGEIVFLTEGDPLLYSTWQHLLPAVARNCEIEICPGISAMSAAACASEFPLAIEEETLIVASAASALPRLSDWLAQGETVVLYKAAKRLGEISAILDAAETPIRAVLVERCSDSSQRILTDPKSWNDSERAYFTIVFLKAERPEKETAHEN